MIRKLFIPLLLLIGLATSTQAQEMQIKRPQPKLWFGVSGAANFNYFTGTTQSLNSLVYAPSAFHKGSGVAPYGSLFFEYRPNPVFGLMFNLGYDNRSGSFDQVIAPCNCPADLEAKVSYLTMEPSLRIAPFSNGFYVFLGGVFSDNFKKSFDYFQEQQPDRSGDFSDMRKWKIGGQIGAGYDIPLSSASKLTQVNLSPFIAFQPYFGQAPRSIESWSMQTLRVGLALKFGKGTKETVIEELPPAVIAEVPVVVAEPEVKFTVNSPANIPKERSVRETFPLRNYIFFNLESTDIPDRYVLLRKNQVKDFKEDQLESYAPLKVADRSKREMTVYYNVLNILGDRMGKNPNSTITLVGSSEKGPKDGKLMAESVKKYLVDVFAISANRIAIEGRKKPKIPSEQPGGKLELVLLREGDRRVSVESSSPAILMEFQSGPDAPLKPVEFIALQEAPVDSYVSFNVEGAKEAFNSYTLEIADEQGKVQYYGPYSQETVTIPGKTILGDRPVGDYKVTMVGQTKGGNTVRKDASVHMVLWTPPKGDYDQRYSIIYEFNDSKSILIYEKYLTEIVTPKIPVGATVIIHGYTDIIGDEISNKKLSLARATDVKGIFDRALAKAGRNDVKFEILGFGEDQTVSPFNNNLPEERFYNRTVIIDVIAKK